MFCTWCLVHGQFLSTGYTMNEYSVCKYLSCHVVRETLVFLEIVVSLELEVKEVKMENLDRPDD